MFAISLLVVIVLWVYLSNSYRLPQSLMNRFQKFPCSSATHEKIWSKKEIQDLLKAGTLRFNEYLPAAVMNRLQSGYADISSVKNETTNFSSGVMNVFTALDLYASFVSEDMRFRDLDLDVVHRSPLNDSCDEEFLNMRYFMIHGMKSDGTPVNFPPSELWYTYLIDDLLAQAFSDTNGSVIMDAVVRDVGRVEFPKAALLEFVTLAMKFVEKATNIFRARY